MQIKYDKMIRNSIVLPNIFAINKKYYYLHFIAVNICRITNKIITNAIKIQVVLSIEKMRATKNENISYAFKSCKYYVLFAFNCCCKAAIFLF